MILTKNNWKFDVRPQKNVPESMIAYAIMLQTNPTNPVCMAIEDQQLSIPILFRKSHLTSDFIQQIIKLNPKQFQPDIANQDIAILPVSKQEITSYPYIAIVSQR